MYSPASGQREEEAVGYDFGQGIRDRFLSFLLDGHARGEGADFECVGASELICCFSGHGLDDGLLQLACQGCHRCRFQGIDLVELVR